MEFGKSYQFSLQAVGHVGQCSQKRPMLLGSLHSHLPHTHVPLPLHTWPLELTQCWAKAVEHWQRSPSQPLKHRHSPASHSPCPATQTSRELRTHALCHELPNVASYPVSFETPQCLSEAAQHHLLFEQQV